jgi:DUSP domain
MIDNSEMEQILVISDRKDRLKKNIDYFLLTKAVWEFFLSIYGGGPTIVLNN